MSASTCVYRWPEASVTNCILFRTKKYDNIASSKSAFKLYPHGSSERVKKHPIAISFHGDPEIYCKEALLVVHLGQILILSLLTEYQELIFPYNDEYRHGLMYLCLHFRHNECRVAKIWAALLFLDPLGILLFSNLSWNFFKCSCCQEKLYSLIIALAWKGNHSNNTCLSFSQNSPC